ncbi:carboxymuconolactone decarboxylase family protein [uncultured Cytophaga sp.]|uniref:carboxymuconolactone decarboxylase family protein n=1 Tax=uncultured Cytophaga sp. TaxID=160238 RepID=UPI00260CBFB0|nr:carboxymuconolactone decarboxylase family protein [uncultured Cytophaga sp.]
MSNTTKKDMIQLSETSAELVQLIRIEDAPLPILQLLDSTDSRYIRDLKVNISNALQSTTLTETETALLALSIASNQKNNALVVGFQKLALEKGASIEEQNEAISCASLLAGNNVFYRFRHFQQKESYNNMQAKIKMNIMMKPVLGKEFFELISLAVSAVNGCEMCVNAHEHSVRELGASEERVWDAIRLSSVIVSLDKVVN